MTPDLLYFVPQHGCDVKLAELADLGLAHAFDAEAGFTPRGCQHGPGGDSGVVVARPDALAIGYYPDAQDWIQIPLSACYVGRPRAATIIPDTLLRDSALPGHLVELGDGQTWLAPMARRCVIDSAGEYVGPGRNLPAKIGVDAQTGEWTDNGLAPDHLRLWELATTWWDTREAGEIEEVEDGESTLIITFADVMDAALVALQANYRVAKAEVALLGLFSTSSAMSILDALIDWPTLREYVKKKESRPPAGSSSDNGAKGSPLVSAQP